MLKLWLVAVLMTPTCFNDWRAKVKTVEEAEATATAKGEGVVRAIGDTDAPRFTLSFSDSVNQTAARGGDSSAGMIVYVFTPQDGKPVFEVLGATQCYTVETEEVSWGKEPKKKKKK